MRNHRQQRSYRSRHSVREFDPFIGRSARIRELARTAASFAASESPIRIHGETGTGKGVLARWLHEHGPRAGKAFVEVGCAGMSSEQLCRELFGYHHEGSAGADLAKAGLLELAHHGTIFLDEIGDVDPRIQSMLGRVIEQQRFRRLGEVREREVDVRLITASNQDMDALTRQGRLRNDLRISSLPLELPPLRDRREDIPLLAQDILSRLCSESSRPPVLSAGAVTALQQYEWPGNIRELRNVLERAVLLGSSNVLALRDLHFDTCQLAIPASHGETS
ncbi:MAG: sigma-54-dependent Fis family transcriptional regulator [bacterium]|nr:sigma-54-dependent Fis family transcriptional regulator [bacterium]